MSKIKEILNNLETCLCEICGNETIQAECNLIPMANSPDDFDLVPVCPVCSQEYADYAGDWSQDE